MTNNENKEIQDVLSQLQRLEPTADSAPRPAHVVFAKLRPRLHNRPQAVSISHSILRSFIMNNRKLAIGLASLIVLLAIALSFPAVRAAASDFLGLFRVQKFSAISVSPEQLALLQKLGEEGLTPGEFQMINEPQEPRSVKSLQEAQEASGLLVKTLPSLGNADQIMVTGQGEAVLTLNAKNLQGILTAVHADPSLISDSLDGSPVHVSIYPGVAQNWGETVFVQMTSPMVEYPENLDPVTLGTALLQVLGMNSDEAASLAKSIDWTSTLVLPIPQEAATFQEVTIHGVSGLSLNSLDGTHSALIWQENGILYLLEGNNAQELLGLTDQLQ